VPPARRGGAALVLAALAAVVACSATTDAAEGKFEPLQAGRLLVATSLPAPGFWEAEGGVVTAGGFEGALAADLADEFDLDLDVQDIPFPDIVDGDLHDADLALAQVSITGEREENAAFSIPYYTSYPTVLGRSGEELTDLATAKEQVWAVRRSTTEQEYVEDVIRPDDDPVLVDGEQDAVDAVLSGRADMALVDLATAMILAKRTDGIDVLSRFDQREEYGIVLPKGSDNGEAVDKLLRQFDTDGTLDDLASTWLDPLYAVDPDSIPVIDAR
jgi:polar amino acid transport system substrate-binding protein